MRAHGENVQNVDKEDSTECTCPGTSCYEEFWDTARYETFLRQLRFSCLCKDLGLDWFKLLEVTVPWRQGNTLRTAAGLLCTFSFIRNSSLSARAVGYMTESSTQYTDINLPYFCLLLTRPEIPGSKFPFVIWI